VWDAKSGFLPVRVVGRAGFNVGRVVQAIARMYPEHLAPVGRANGKAKDSAVHPWAVQKGA